MRIQIGAPPATVTSATRPARTTRCLACARTARPPASGRWAKRRCTRRAATSSTAPAPTAAGAIHHMCSATATAARSTHAIAISTATIGTSARATSARRIARRSTRERSATRTASAACDCTMPAPNAAAFDPCTATRGSGSPVTGREHEAPGLRPPGEGRDVDRDRADEGPRRDRVGRAVDVVPVHRDESGGSGRGHGGEPAHTPCVPQKALETVKVW